MKISDQDWKEKIRHLWTLYNWKSFHNFQPIQRSIHQISNPFVNIAKRSSKRKRSKDSNRNSFEHFGIVHVSNNKKKLSSSNSIPSSYLCSPRAFANVSIYSFDLKLKQKKLSKLFFLSFSSLFSLMMPILTLQKVLNKFSWIKKKKMLSSWAQINCYQVIKITERYEKLMQNTKPLYPRKFLLGYWKWWKWLEGFIKIISRLIRTFNIFQLDKMLSSKRSGWQLVEEDISKQL